MLTRSSSAVLFKCVWSLAVAVGFAVAGDARASGLTWPWSAPAQASTSERGVFPTITAEALDRSVLKLPGQLEGRQNLLLLSWDRDQAAQVETWTAVGQALQHTQPEFRVYRMLVSAPENVVFRWWDNASLRAGETDPDLLHWDVPLYTDEANLRRSLGLNAGDRAVIALLVERSGRILWMARGASTAATRSGLLSAAHATP